MDVPTDSLIAMVQRSTSVAQVLAELQLPIEGRPHRELSNRIRALGLDTSHFRGMGWARGETKESHPATAASSRKQRIPDDKVFIENGPLLGGPRLMRRLLAIGWTYQCTECGIATWREKPLVLHVDHINGIANDNRVSNLRLLCPLCRAQTDTYCNRARAKPTAASESRGSYACYTARMRAWWNGRHTTFRW